MNKKKILMLFSIILLLVIICFFSLNIYINKQEEKKYYIIDKEEVPSIYTIVGKRNIIKYKSFKNICIYKNIYQYKDIKNVSSDLSKYTSELKENYNYLYTSNIDFTKKSDNISMAKKIDENQIIMIEIEYNDNSYKITISKGKGNINEF